MQGRQKERLAGPLTAYYLDQISKQALIDLASDLVAMIEGNDPDDETVMNVLAKDYLPPVIRFRKDRMPSVDKARRYVANDRIRAEQAELRAAQERESSK